MEAEWECLDALIVMSRTTLMTKSIKMNSHQCMPNLKNNMKNYWCEDCGNRWKTEWDENNCPRCSSQEIRVTMSEEEAKEKGLI